MLHMVIHRSADGQSVYHPVDSLEDAARHVEQLHNSSGGSDAKIFAMVEVPIEVKTYYKVEVATTDGKPSDAAPAVPADAASGGSPAAPASAPPMPPPPPLAPTAPPPGPAPANPGMTPVPAATKGEPVAASGRFGLFGKA